MNISKEQLYTLHRIAKQAGEAILEVYRQDFDVSYKDDSSPLTEADLASHHCILKGLAEAFPDIPVLSEESAEVPYQERAQWDCFFLIDPLDGTKEFVKRNGEFTVNIALICGQEAVAGVVYAPVLERSYLGAKQLGALKIEAAQEQRIAIAPYQGGPLKVVASRSHASADTEAFLTRLAQDIPEQETLSIGSSLKLCLVAEGAAHIYPRFGPTMEWDSAAAHAIVSAAGGRVYQPNGEELSYNKENLLNPFFLVSHDALAWSKYL